MYKWIYIFLSLLSVSACTPNRAVNELPVSGSVPVNTLSRCAGMSCPTSGGGVEAITH